jgi:hypothetical protein
VAISFAGQLPVSAVNVGLNASLGAIDVELAQLAVDLAGLTASLEYQAQVTVNFPPNVPGYTVALEAACNVLQIAAELTPGLFSVNAGPIALDVGIELGLVAAKLEAALAIAAPLEAGLSVGGIAGWSYAGSARGFGERLQAATTGGFGRTPPNQQIQATILATENPTTWAGLSSGVYTGAEADGLTYLGQIGATDWSVGLGSLMARIRLFLGELRGLKAMLEAQIEFCAGLELPDLTVTLQTGLDVIAELGIEGLLDNLVNVDVGLQASIDGIQVRIDALIALKLDIAASLSGGGLATWTYSGPASLLGTELAGEIGNGVPGGNGPSASVHGFVLAASPATMGSFGSIFLV